MKTEDTGHFLDHPDVKRFMNELFPVLVKESDRGAVLLASSQIDEQLKDFFEGLVPSNINNKRKKEILSYPGPFSSLSSKLNIAYVSRLLPADLIESIFCLKKIRNGVAHNPTGFDLGGYTKEIYEMFGLIGKGVGLGINQIAVTALAESVLVKVMEIPDPIDSTKKAFSCKEDAMSALSGNQDVLAVLDEQRLRWELGIGTAIICALILIHKVKLIEILGEVGTVVSTARRRDA